ncbi:MAG: desulfoferrodoxin [Deltaproteobacteria bacterium]|nr:desulfoferrodoxin [Deltaproteobacteria bacterium]
MRERMQVYKCEVCGNIVEVLHGGAGTLVCCGQDMRLVSENTTDAATEKHVPVIEKTADGYLVTVGSTAHPMEAKHYIEWIELNADGKLCREYLEPGGKPQAAFCIQADKVSAREYCNIHGLWKGEPT